MKRTNKLPGYYYLKKSVRNNTVFDLKSNILLFSDPRGGSTWFSECLTSALKLPIIWEPLHIRKVEELKDLNFGWRQFIHEQNEDKNIKAFFEKLFKGKIKSDWLYQYSSFSSLLFSKSAIFKICRGNQIIPYIVHNFQFEQIPIYFVRHPFAVVASQLKQGGWSNNTGKMSLSEISKDELKKEHKNFLLKLRTKEEVLVANWCLTNKIPLKHKFNDKKWITITYEEFIEDPLSTFKRIEKRWNINLKTNKIDFSKNSFTTVDKVESNFEDQINKWKTQFSKQQIDDMCNVLNYFDIKLYTVAPFPTKRYNIEQ